MLTPIDVNTVKINAEVVYCPKTTLMFPAKLVHLPRDVTSKSWGVRKIEPAKDYYDVLYYVEAKDLYTCSYEDLCRVVDAQRKVSAAEAAEEKATEDMEVAHHAKRLALLMRTELARSLLPEPPGEGDLVRPVAE